MGEWAKAEISRIPAFSIRSISARKRVPSPSFEPAGRCAGGERCKSGVHRRHWRHAGAISHPVRAVARAVCATSVRSSIRRRQASWRSASCNGLLVYYTHLMSYRCAIREMRIGIDSGVPDKVIKLPPCNLKDPVAIPPMRRCL